MNQQELIKEAEQWVEKANCNYVDAYIAGANSTYVKNQIIEAKIEAIEYYVWDERESANNPFFNSIRSLMIQEIQSLKTQLKENGK